MKRPPRIRVIGSINLDIVARVHTLPRPGETVSGGVFSALSGWQGCEPSLSRTKAWSRRCDVRLRWKR